MSKSTTFTVSIDEDAYGVFQAASEIVSKAGISRTFAYFGGLKIFCVVLL